MQLKDKPIPSTRSIVSGLFTNIDTIRQAGVFIILICLLLFFSIYLQYFLSLGNFVNVSRQASVMFLVSVGMTLVFLSGEIDLSVGSIVGLATVIFALLMRRTDNSLFICISATLFIGMLCGFINGVLIAYCGIASFIVTFCTLGIYFGTAYYLVVTGRIPITDSFFKTLFGYGKLGPVPYGVIMVAIVFIIFHLILSRSVFGYQVYMCGSNELASKYSGINTRLIKLKTFIISGLLSSLAGLMMAAQMGTCHFEFGRGIEIPVIIAVVLGGARFGGGWGTLPGTLLGTMSMAILMNGLTMFGMQYHGRQLVMACLLVFIVWLDTFLRRNIHSN